MGIRVKGILTGFTLRAVEIPEGVAKSASGPIKHSGSFYTGILVKVASFQISDVP